jgi:nicotinamidase/pyrazinamidase
MKAFFDIDTQIDFVSPSGALYTPGADQVIPMVATLNQYAGEHGITLISSMCAHSENAEEFDVWPPHCVVGTVGQQKPAETLLADKTKQIFIEKDELDLFSNPALLPLLDHLDIDECFVYGVLTEYCVKYAIMGLLKSGRKVWLVTDAIAHYTSQTGEQVIREFLAAGGQCTTAAAAFSQATAAEHFDVGDG